MTDKKLIVYRAECGDELELEQTLAHSIRFICCDCGTYHNYCLETITEGISWDDVVDSEVWERLQSGDQNF